MGSRHWRQQGIADPDKLQYPVTIIGAGAIGSFTTLALAKIGITDLEVYDFDKIEEHNLPNQFFRNSDLGKAKVQALRDLVIDFDGVEIKAREEKYIKQDLKGYVIVAVDNMKARHEIWKKVKLNVNVPRFIDARMGGELMRIYTINPIDIDDIKFYEAHLYKKAKALKCTERAILYNVLSIASFITNNLKKAMLAEPVDREIIFNLKSMLLMKRR